MLKKWSDVEKPEDYIAAREAIRSAIETELVEGQLHKVMRDGFDSAYVEYELSNVQVSSLINWLDERGFTTSAFKKPESKTRGYLDPEHPRFSSKLAAVVEAWESYDLDSTEPGTPKQRIMKWLRLNASRFGLTNEDGRPNENVIEELAKVANWLPRGGAPKIKNEEPTTF